MKFYLMWANHDAGYTWDKRHSDCDKINGCPVFMIYDVMNLMKGLGGVDKTREAIEHEL